MDAPNNLGSAIETWNSELSIQRFFGPRSTVEYVVGLERGIIEVESCYRSAYRP